MPRTILTLAALAAVLAASATSAQDRTGVGGGPTGTVTAPNKSAVGQTKPPTGGDAGAATADAPRDARTPRQDQDDKISQGICIGCGAK